MTLSDIGILQVRLFGMFEARLDGAVLPGLLARPRSQQLLALLCLHPGQVVPNEWLASQLWPITGSTDSLSHEVPVLRKELGGHGERLAAPRGGLCLNVYGVEVDTLAFDTAWEQREQNAAALQQAVEQARGPLLQGWYDEWIPPFRAEYQRRYLKALRWLALYSLAQSELQEARDYLQRLVQAGDPASSLHMKLLVAYLHGRHLAEAAQFYEAYRDYLRSEHHLAPPEEMTALVASIPRTGPFAPQFPAAQLAAEPVGGAVPLDSPYYIRRAADALFHASIARRDSIVLLRGPRQGGKTSLLARGLEQARQAGSRVVVTDFEKLGTEETATQEAFFLALARRIRRALAIETAPEEVWDPLLGANANFEGYLRDELLARTQVPVVWGIDEADSIFDRPYRDNVFGLFRSWYNERALEPDSPWQWFTLILTYSTEAHLYIANLHQSPFNVGTRIVLDDFTPEQAAELNAKYEHPLAEDTDLARLSVLVDGHPFLVRRCLCEARANGWDRIALEAEALREGGFFTEHLQRMTAAVSRDADLVAALRGLLQGKTTLSPDHFSRLRAAGVIKGESAEEALLRCGLYTNYLRRHLL